MEGRAPETAKERAGQVTREELRRLVWSRWGPRLERATLEELQEGLLELQGRASPAPAGAVFLAETEVANYEEAMREFFGHVLAADSESGFVQLWLTALECWLALMLASE